MKMKMLRKILALVIVGLLAGFVVAVVVNEISTSAGNLVLNSAGTQTIVNEGLNITGGDADDNWYMTTVSNEPTLYCYGGGNTNIKTDGGDIDFYDTSVGTGASIFKIYSIASGTENITSLYLYAPINAQIGTGNYFLQIDYVSKTGSSNVQYGRIATRDGDLILDADRDTGGNVRPAVDNVDSLGSATYEWKEVWAADTSINHDSLFMWDRENGNLYHIGINPVEGLVYETIKLSDLEAANIVGYEPVYNDLGQQVDSKYTIKKSKKLDDVRTWKNANPDKVETLSVKELKDENTALKQVLITKGVITKQEVDIEKAKI